MAQEKVCNNCGRAMNEDSKFCPGCGTSVVTPSDVDCPSCGYRNTSNQRYCSSCGISLTMSVRQTDKPKSVLSPVTIILRIFLVVTSIVIFPVGIAIGAFYIVRKKNMTFGAVLLGIGIFVLILFVVLAQSDSSRSPEQELMERAGAYYSEINRQNWSDAHKYLSPDIRKACTPEDYTVSMVFIISFVKGAVDISANEPLTFKINNVLVNGSQGFVYGAIWAKEKEISSDDETDGSPWVYSEGEWWYSPSEWYNGCRLGF